MRSLVEVTTLIIMMLMHKVTMMSLLIFRPVILRNLNEVGLYSRFSVTIFLMFIGVGVTPFLIANISVDKESPLPSRIYWFVVVVIDVYPTLFYYTLDIYRDVFMLFIFCNWTCCG